MTSNRGGLSARGKKFAIVVSEFNEFITRRLLESACQTLKKAGARPQDVEIYWVPGALEVPFFTLKVLKKKRVSALIALACIIRGETYHYEAVCHEITRGVSQAALETGIPVATAILTTENLEQAIDRAGLKAGNKGRDAALAAIEIANLKELLSFRRA